MQPERGRDARAPRQPHRAGPAEPLPQPTSGRVPQQAIVEFVAAVTRPQGKLRPLLQPVDALREAEELLSQFEVLYPNEDVVRTALRGAAAYQLSWFDAHIWAYAEHYGLTELWSEDFQDGRLYGTVTVRNPFAAA